MELGQKVIVVEEWRITTEVWDGEITAIGRKYVTVTKNDSKWVTYQFDKTTGCSKEEKGYSRSATLYLSKQDYENHLEGIRLSDEIRKAIGQWGKIPLNIDQLREIHKIINQ